MKIIKIRKNKGLENYLFSLAVDKTIKENSRFVDEYGRPGRHIQIYESPFEGVIIYKRFIDDLNKYRADIELLGFDEKSFYFKKLKSNLREIAKTKDSEIIKNNFLRRVGESST